ncbi:MAG TPA: hypothetical protein VFN31_00875 [Candidatus Saccharimonadales bacterium]|nr:hypothetical protein [Candidatus Saccharimonadales bacterium]
MVGILIKPKKGVVLSLRVRYMQIGPILYETAESISATPAKARASLAKLSGFMMALSGALAASAETTNSLPIQVITGLGAIGSAGSAYFSFDGYMYGRSLAAESSSLLMPVAVESVTDIEA